MFKIYDHVSKYDHLSTVSIPKKVNVPNIVVQEELRTMTRLVPVNFRHVSLPELIAYHQ